MCKVNESSPIAEIMQLVEKHWARNLRCHLSSRRQIAIADVPALSLPGGSAN